VEFKADYFHCVEVKNTRNFSFTAIVFIHGIMLWHRDSIILFVIINNCHYCGQAVLFLLKLIVERR
jgi:hypothetical protein